MLFFKKNLLLGLFTSILTLNHTSANGQEVQTIPPAQSSYTAIARTNTNLVMVIKSNNNGLRIEEGQPGSTSIRSYFVDKNANKVTMMFHQQSSPPKTKKIESALNDIFMPFYILSEAAVTQEQYQIASELCTEHYLTQTLSGFAICLTQDYIPLRVRFVNADHTQELIYEVTEINRKNVTDKEVMLIE